MPSTSAVYLRMRKRRAIELVEERIDGVSVEEPSTDGEAVVRLDGEDAPVVTIAEEDSSAASPTVRLDYVTEGSPRAERKAGQVRRLLSRRAR